MNNKIKIVLLLLSLQSATVLATCEPYNGNGNAVLALSDQYQDGCLGDVNDKSEIRKEVVRQLPEIDVSKLKLRSSADLTQLRIKASSILDDIAVSLAQVPRDDNFAPLFGQMQVQLAKDRSKVLAALEHSAQHWGIDNMMFLDDSVDIGSLLGTTCNMPDNTDRCLFAFKQGSELIRHATLIREVLFESNDHIRLLTAEYVKLDKQWDYYFTGARSQYIWELALNSWRYDKQLISDCKKKKNTVLIGWELKKFCKDRLDVQLSTPPTGQWILMHPSAALEYTSTDEAGNSSASAVAILELVGYNKFAGKNGMPLKWPIGVSIISTISLDNNGDRFGYGAMLHLKNSFSIGVARRDFSGKKETTWLLSADLGKLLTSATAEAQEKFKFLDR